MSSADFYKSLDSFTDFNEVAKGHHYTPVPADWSIVIADIKNSTKAVEAGRYKEVNTIGAAVISTVQNALECEFPYVFGGDGATILVSPDTREIALKALNDLRQLSQEQFGLELRVGAVLVKEIMEAGHSTEVAKFALNPRKSVAFIRGGGVSYADNLIKVDEARYCQAMVQSDPIALDGLSCRWENIPSKQGVVLALLVVSRQADSAVVFEKILTHLNAVFGNDLNAANPIDTTSMRYRTIKESLKNERRYHSSVFSWKYCFRFVEIIVATFIFKYGFPAFVFNAKDYKESMALHSDYRKFDDMLRMIVDCTHEQAEEIKQYLEKLHQAGDIFFGLHGSDSSLMTCYVQETGEGEHIHFIDGSGGGYTMAAKALKAMMRAS